MKAIAQIGLLMAGRISFQHLFKTCVLRTLQTGKLRAETVCFGERHGVLAGQERYVSACDIDICWGRKDMLRREI